MRAPVLDAAALGVGGAEVEPADARERDRRRAHRAGLQRDVEVGARRAAPSPSAAQACADRQHLGVRGRVGQLARAVAGAGQHRAVRAHDHGAHRHLAARGRGLGLGERRQHVALWPDEVS